MLRTNSIAASRRAALEIQAAEEQLEVSLRRLESGNVSAEPRARTGRKAAGEAAFRPEPQSE